MEPKTEPLAVLRSDKLDTELVRHLSLAYLVTVEAQDNEIVYTLYRYERSNT